MKPKRKTDENLVSLGNRTTEEQRKIAQKGGIASGEVRREKKALRAILNEELAKPDSENPNLTKLEALVARAITKAGKGAELSDLMKLQELLGEKQLNVAIESRKPEEVARDILNTIGE